MISRSSEVQRYLTNQRISGKFIVARAPWWGGFWERMVQTVKRSLRKSIGRATLRFDELNTILIEVKSTVNCRPLTFVYDDTEGVSYPLTSSHLINGQRLTSSSSASHFEVISTNQSLTRRAKNQRHILEQLEKRLPFEFTWTSPSQVEEDWAIGDVVIVRDDYT